MNAETANLAVSAASDEMQNCRCHAMGNVLAIAEFSANDDGSVVIYRSVLEDMKRTAARYKAAVAAWDAAVAARNAARSAA